MHLRKKAMRVISTECPLWIEKHMPRLDGLLSRAGQMDHCRVVLNKVTGLDVPGSGDIEQGLAQFHRALLAMTPEQRADIEAKAASGEI